MIKNYFKLIAEKATTKETNDLDNYIDSLQKEREQKIKEHEKELIKNKEKNREKLNSIINIPNSKKRIDSNTDLPVVDDLDGDNMIFIPELGKINIEKNAYRFITWTDDEMFKLNQESNFDVVFYFDEGGKLGGQEYYDKIIVRGTRDLSKTKLIVWKIMKILSQYFKKNISLVLIENDNSQDVVNIKTMKSNIISGFVNPININPKPRYDTDKYYSDRDNNKRAKYFSTSLIEKENYMKNLKSKTKTFNENRIRKNEERKRIKNENFLLTIKLCKENPKMMKVVNDIFDGNDMSNLFYSKINYPFDLLNILNTSFPEIIDEVVSINNEEIEKNKRKYNVYEDVEEYINDKCKGMDKYKIINEVYNKFNMNYDDIIYIYEKTDNEKSGLNFEIGQEGGFNITLNGKKIDAKSDPKAWELLQGIRKKYPKEFGEISQVYNPDNVDILIDSGKLTITNDKGKILIDEEPLKSSFTKDDLIRMGVIRENRFFNEGIKNKKFKSGDKVQYKVQKNDNYKDNNGKIIVKPGTYIKGTVKKIEDDDKVTVKWNDSKLGEETNFPVSQLSFQEDKNYPNIEIGGGGTKIGIDSTSDMVGVGYVSYGKEFVKIIKNILGNDFIKIAEKNNDPFDLIINLEDDIIDVYDEKGKKFKEIIISDYPELESFFKKAKNIKESKNNFENIKNQIRKYLEKKGIIFTNEEIEEMGINENKKEIEIKYFKLDDYINMKKYGRRDLEEEKDFNGTIVKFTIFNENGEEYVGFTVLDNIIV